MKKLLLLALLSTPVLADQVRLEVVAQPTQCVANHKCDLRASHNIELINTTDQDHWYTFSYKICAEKEYADCKVIGDRIRLYAHHTWENHHDSLYTSTFTNSGVHHVIAFTTIGEYIHEERQDMKPVDVR